jgi:hypothetical protein
LRQHFFQLVFLTAETNLTEATVQANKCQTAEARTTRTIAGVNAVFENEFSFQAVAQIFNTFETDTAGRVQA